ELAGSWPVPQIPITTSESPRPICAAQAHDNAHPKASQQLRFPAFPAKTKNCGRKAAKSWFLQRGTPFDRPPARGVAQSERQGGPPFTPSVRGTTTFRQKQRLAGPLLHLALGVDGPPLHGNLVEPGFDVLGQRALLGGGKAVGKLIRPAGADDRR